MLGAADKIQPARSGHLNHGPTTLEAPRGGHRVAERAGNHRRSVGAAERGQRALPTVGQRDPIATQPVLGSRLGDGRGDLRRIRGTAELVGSGHDSHTTIVPGSAARTRAIDPSPGRRRAEWAGFRSAGAPAAEKVGSWPCRSDPDRWSSFPIEGRSPTAAKATARCALVRGGGGGLVSGLAPLVADTDTIWIASALSDEDREGASGLVTVEGFRVELVNHDPAVLTMAYDVIGNSVLWFVHHGLFELARRPRYDHAFRTAWDAYRQYNQTFADTVVATAPPDAIVLVQDYHLSLMAPLVRARRSDLSLVHFAHTPFAGPERLSLLPDPYRRELLEGLSGNQACGFHTDRWRQRFLASCAEFSVPAPATFASSLAPDGADLAQVASGDACARWRASFDERFADQQLIVRVDRIELSKNILRGFWAYAELLERWPSFHGRVSFMASIYPSREGLAEYLAYRQEVESLADRINGRYGTDTWKPVVLETSDDFPRSGRVAEPL